MTPCADWHRLLHVLWTKAVDTPGYDKKEWLDLDNECVRLTQENLALQQELNESKQVIRRLTNL